MRIVSQHGNVDLPYENTVLLHNMEFVVAQFDGKEYVMGKYSSEEKAYKVMKLLQRVYCNLVSFNTIFSGKVDEITEQLRSVEGFDESFETFTSSNVFQFPKDEEVEDEV